MEMVYYERLGPLTYYMERGFINGCFVLRSELVVDGIVPPAPPPGSIWDLPPAFTMLGGSGGGGGAGSVPADGVGEEAGADEVSCAGGEGGAASGSGGHRSGDVPAGPPAADGDSHAPDRRARRWPAGTLRVLDSAEDVTEGAKRRRRGEQ